MPDVSIIIRAKNEEAWIGHCLKMVFAQDYENFEVVLVDNASTDNTVAIARRYPVAQVINIDHFKPGLAINEGIKVSRGRLIVCLSAHCVPRSIDWLSQLSRNFVDAPHIAGVYGRQLPVSFTEPIDKRDLLTVFGLDRRVQEKDYFFHNANSMFPRSIWDQFPFDEDVTNVEDRVWGKDVIDAGYNIIYDPDAAVYHYHGLHQGNTLQRAKGVVSVIEKMNGDVLDDLPDPCTPANINVAAVLLVSIQMERSSRLASLLNATLRDLNASRYVKKVYVVSNQREFALNGASWINRSSISDVDALGLDELFQRVLNEIEAEGDYPNFLLYVNHDYLLRPPGLFDELIADSQYKGYDTVFPGYIDYGHYWFKAEGGDFKQTDPSLRGRSERDPVFRALYGLGCLSSTVLIRQGKMVGGKIGIFPLEHMRYTLRCRDVGDLAIATSFNGREAMSRI